MKFVCFAGGTTGCCKRT